MRVVVCSLLSLFFAFSFVCQATEPGAGTASPGFVDVFASGQGGYAAFRIPAIVALPDGTLAAFAEGRRDNTADFGNIDIVMRRSADGGATWGPLQTLVSRGGQISNPAPVVDTSDPRFPGGRLLLFYNTGDFPEDQIVAGRGPKHVYVATSADGGATWGEPRDISAQVNRAFLPQGRGGAPWRYYANTPGHALQLASGRLLVAANHSTPPVRRDGGHYRAHAFYSDDHGDTFHISDDLPLAGSNESMAAQTSDGTVVVTSRNQLEQGPRRRIMARSADGGASWAEAGYNEGLPEPRCQGAVVALDGGRLLAHSNPASTVARDSLTVRLSLDGGRTWPWSRLVYDTSRSANPADVRDAVAYSDLVALGPRNLGVLFERDDYSAISFTTLQLP